MSALYVILTIFVLDAYFKADNATVPDWLQSFTHGFLVRATCWNVRCTSQTKVTPKTDKASGESNAVNSLQEASELDHTETVKNAFESGIHGNIPQREANRMYTWKEIAQTLDKCYMYTYT